MLFAPRPAGSAIRPPAALPPPRLAAAVARRKTAA